MAIGERMSARRWIRRYFGQNSSPTLDDVRTDLWTAGIDPEQWAENSKEYASALVQQYALYVEMTDRISFRRGVTNTFFLTLNTTIFAAIAASWNGSAPTDSWLLIFPTLVLIIQCAAWFWLVRSYRQLNAAKYAVVGAFEERLPASPYWRAEWKALGEGNDPSRYWPLSHLEQWIPALFAASYFGGFLATVLA